MNEFIIGWQPTRNAGDDDSPFDKLKQREKSIEIASTSTGLHLASNNCIVSDGHDEAISVGSSATVVKALETASIKSNTDDLPTMLRDEAPGFVGATVNDNGIRGLTDWIGSRPLYATTTSTGLHLIATNIPWLLSVPGVSDDIEPQSVYNFIHFHIVPGPATIFRSIRKIGAASLFKIDQDSHITEQRYWPPAKTISSESPETLQRALREKMADAVGRLHDGSDQVACFLSGGLDSSTIAGLLSKQASTTHAFTIGFGQDGYDEMPYAETAAKHFGLQHHKSYITPTAVHELLPKLAGSFGEPFGNLSCIPAYYCARMAHQEGFSTMFAGDGGDELFAGNERYARHKLIGAYQKLPRLIRKSMEPAMVKLVGNRISLLHKIGRYIDIAKDDLPVRLLEDFEHFQDFAPEEIFSERFLSHVNKENPVHLLRQMVESSPDGDLLETLLWVDWKITLTDNDLRKVHYACKSTGVTPLFPMLDRELMEFSRSIPPRQKLTKNRLRAMFKDAYSDFLPESIINKPKHGFGLPFGEWLRDNASLRELCETSFSRMEQRALFNQDFIPKLRNAHRDTHAAYFGTMIGTILMLDLWLESNENLKLPM
ncbi:MAG: asparagine synthase-related protein [Pseudomonadota bacterium]